jgi:site-specific recombinase XerD
MGFLLDTGIRASELTALKMRDYEPKRGQLIIHHGKGDKKRVVFLGSAAKQGVWRYLATLPGARPIRSSPPAKAQPCSAPACAC